MIIKAPAIIRRSSSSEPEVQRVKGATVTGLDVIVIVEAIYNGPNNKSLGVCKPDQRITVAGGPYGQSLIDSGLVRRAGDEAPPAVSAPEPDIVAVENTAQTAVALQNALTQLAESNTVAEPDDGYLVFTDAVSATIARKVWDAGFRDKEGIAESYTLYGTAKLTEISGVGLNSAIKLVRWAGLDPEVTY